MEDSGESSKNNALFIPHVDEIELFEQRGFGWATAMLAGSIAGVSEHLVMYPVDTLKTRLQVVGQPGMPFYHSVPHAFRQIYQTEGLLHLYRGLPAVICGAIPSHAVYFAAYETVKTKLGVPKYNTEHRPLEMALAGSCATMAHDAVVTPLDVVKQRMQLFNSSYKGVISCIRSIAKEQGLRAFVASYPTTVAMNIPFMAVHFAAYESLKIFCYDVFKTGHDSPMTHICSGAGAGALGAVASQPLDIIKTRIQTCTGVEGTTFLKEYRKIVQNRGFAGLFQGVSARILYFMPSAAICWTSYETMKRILDSM